MRVVLRFFGVFRSASGTSELALDLLTGSTVRSLVNELAEREQFQEFKKLFLDTTTSDPRPNALILVSGREISSLNGLETLLHEGDEVAILPIAHGG